MIRSWKELTSLSGGAALTVERVRLVEKDLAIEGQFEPPPLARLTEEDQVFVAAFVRCHGSIKQMEKFFGVSYPTIKNRLNRIGDMLPFAEVEAEEPPGAGDLLAKLERGEVSVQHVLDELRNKNKKEVQE